MLSGARRAFECELRYSWRVLVLVACSTTIAESTRTDLRLRWPHMACYQSAKRWLPSTLTLLTCTLRREAVGIGSQRLVSINVWPMLTCCLAPLASIAKRVAVGTPHGPRMVDLRKVTAPVVLHLLKSEKRFPRLFLLRCRLTVKQFQEGIDPRFPAELIDLAAPLPWVCTNLKQRHLTGGMAQWNLACETPQPSARVRESLRPGARGQTREKKPCRRVS
jgi:hypothetical protein